MLAVLEGGYMLGCRSRTIPRGLVGLAFLFEIFVAGLAVACSRALNSSPSANGATNMPNVASMVYGVNVDMTALVPGTAYTITTASGGNFFDLAQQLGINTVRITDFQWESSGNEYSAANWRHVFDEAARAHMRIVLLLMDGRDQTPLTQAHTLLDQYGLAHSPALWLVDLYNEPDVSDPQVIQALREEAAYVHQVAPTALVTIGGWKSRIPEGPGKFRWQDGADLARVIDLVDVVSAHLFGFVEGAQLSFSPQQWTRYFLNSIRLHAEGKPILLGEFGAGNGLGPGPADEAQGLGGAEWQASVYCGVLNEASAEHDQGVIGGLAWIIAPRPAWPGSSEGDLSGMAFVLNNGTRILPAAQVLSASAHQQHC